MACLFLHTQSSLLSSELCGCGRCHIPDEFSPCFRKYHCHRNFILLSTFRVNEQRNILHEIRKRKANWIGHILRRNCLLKQVIEGKIKGEMEVTRRRGRRRKKLLDDLKNRWGFAKHPWQMTSFFKLRKYFLKEFNQIRGQWRYWFWLKNLIWTETNISWLHIIYWNQQRRTTTE